MALVQNSNNSSNLNKLSGIAKSNSASSSAAKKMNAGYSNASYASISNSLSSSGPSWTTTASPSISSNYVFNDTNLFTANCNLLLFVGKYFTEEEIEKILSDIIERSSVINDDISDDIGRCIKALVRTRHFSEDFLMKYYDYLSRSDILTLHTPDITSGAYAQLALLLTNDDSKSEERDIRQSYLV